MRPFFHSFTGFRYPVLEAGAEEGAETMITNKAFDLENLSTQVERDSRTIKSMKGQRVGEGFLERGIIGLGPGESAPRGRE